MFQKIFTREVKIGLLAVVCGFILFFGCNYLKGINIFNPMNCYFAKYENLGGLIVSSPVYIKGYKVGQVSEIRYDLEPVDTARQGQRISIPVPAKVRPKDKLFVIKKIADDVSA